jgi:hypothetical protein
VAIDFAPTRNTHGEDQPPTLSEEQRDCVLRALRVVQASAPMRSTLQCQTLLQYITEHTLSGELALLRERVIGKEVFGRPADYEPGEDPVVRIRAADLRKRLALYYQSLETPPDLRIDVPSGSYRATFTWKTAESEPKAAAHESSVDDAAVIDSQETLPHIGEVRSDSLELPASSITRSALSPSLRDPASATRSARYWQWSTITLLLLACAFGGVRWYQGRSDRVLRTFWGPLLDSSKPALISIGSNAVYRVSDQGADDYSRQNHIENWGMEFFPQFAPDQSFASTGLHPAETSFVALGDVAAVSETVATFTHLAKTFQERFPNDISFAEVRANPTVLIGGFNNPMTRELTRNFRFVLASRNRIEDRNQPGKAWVLHASTDSHDTEDYAIVTRVLRHEEDEPLVSVAGMGQYGTLAATDLICRPEGLHQLTASLGKDWQRHNLQVVLRIKILDFTPVSTSIIATHTW